MIRDTYLKSITDILNKIEDTQSDKLSQASRLVSEVIKNDGIIYIFGCGHSHLIALDCFYRAGGLANVSAMLDTDLMLHNGAAKSSKIEKMSGIAEEIFKRYCITKNDLLFIISTSGKNAVPVEMAKEAKKNNIPHIAVMSLEYLENKNDNEMLADCAALTIDNCVPYGDAVINIANTDVKIGSVSTAASSYVLQSILLEGAEMAAKDGTAVPIYMSGNVKGGGEYNKELIEKYLPRIKHL